MPQKALVEKSESPEGDPQIRTGRYVVVSIAIIVLAIAGFWGFKRYEAKKNSPEESAYGKIFQSASKDFVCPDGSFFAFSHDPKKPGIFYYYPTPAEAVDLSAQPGTVAPPYQAGIGIGTPGEGLGMMADTADDYQAILTELQSCKNSAGKAPTDVYKVGQFSLH